MSENPSPEEAFAEEAPVEAMAPAAPAAPEAEPESRVYSEADLIEARRQEKEKLYPEISRVKEELAELKRARDEEQERIHQEEARLAEEAKRSAEEEMSVRELLASKEQEWQAQLEAERHEREQAIALLEKERQYAQMQEYRSRRIEEERDEILPELLDLVVGDNPDQIEASIAGLRERSSRIIANAQQAAESARRDMAGARVTDPSAAGPLENYSDSRTFTPDNIRDMSIDEYAQYRESLLGKGTRSEGMFG